MKATEGKLAEFVTQAKTRFIIPIYQRNYDWTDKQVDGLLKDISAVGQSPADDATHFVGSIVYLQDGIYNSSAVKELDIIDGQQRLTSVSLIYARLHEIAITTEDPEQADELRETYLVNKYAKDRKEKLMLPGNNAGTYAQIVNLTLGTGAHAFSRLRENFEHLRRRIQPVDAAIIRKGLGRLVFVDISLERGKDDPQRIFESLNSTGLALSQADLIRNHVLMGFDREEQERLFTLYWEPIERATREQATNVVMVDQYVRDFLTMTQRKITRKSGIYLAFKVYLASQGSAGLSIAAVLEDLKRYAEHYSVILNPRSANDPTLEKELLNLQQIEISTATPFLLRVFEDERTGVISQVQLVEVLRLIETYAWRRFVVNVPTNTLNKTFSTLYESVDTEDYVTSIARALAGKRGTARFPNDREFVAAAREKDFYRVQQRNRAYLFSELENFANNEHVGLDTLTVEHIFPQNPHAGWRQGMDPEEYARFAELYLHRLGNLTLSGNNGKLGNRPFAEKRDMNDAGGEQGYRFSRLWLNRGLQNLEQWDEPAFNERTRYIIDRMLQVWPMPQLPATQVTDTRPALLPLEEVESATNATLADAKLFGISTGPLTFAELYRRVLTELYARDAYQMREPGIMAALYAKEVNTDVRSPWELATGYYVEMNLDSTSKVRALQRVLAMTDNEGEVEVALE